MKVIFRREYDKYMKQWGYLAIFPEAGHNPGKVFSLPFKMYVDGSAIFEPHTEISLEYMYNRKIVHKSERITHELVNHLAKFYQMEQEEIEVVEKMPRKGYRAAYAI